jgi:hypothetical protein
MPRSQATKELGKEEPWETLGTGPREGWWRWSSLRRAAVLRAGGRALRPRFGVPACLTRVAWVGADGARACSREGPPVAEGAAREGAAAGTWPCIERMGILTSFLGADCGMRVRRKISSAIPCSAKTIAKFTRVFN